MAEDDDLEDEDEDEDVDDDGEDEGSPKGGKKKLLIIVGIALLLVVGGAAAAYFTGLMQPLIDLIGAGSEETQEGGEGGNADKEVVFYELPEILVNLNTGGRKAVYLKIRVSLELKNEEDILKIEGKMPRIIDNFQVYLRELRVEDLKGSAGMYRLREELLTRVNAASSPAVVSDVLFKEMLVQ